ncbi:DEKNAAC103453 [Brettanomyces naardenensis]|uniref:DEKNAAC103454 n=1 Tax=Brettanomyces naardenensis TaxID=13370 RepID=A0A448YNH0_BRENA|nr:DEKNAAC103453 [Brettanomyces naardenensis]
MTQSNFPKAIVFDLDYTFWPCWCDAHISTPIRVQGKEIIDAKKFRVKLYPDVVPILEYLKERNVKIYTASRTGTPRIAQKMLKLFELDSYIDGSEWGYNSKVEHINRLVTRHNKDLDEEDKEYLKYEDMCLFDDEYRNSDVERLGVTFCHLVDEKLTWVDFRKGIQGWCSGVRAD